jgi:hypothetical protein
LGYAGSVILNDERLRQRLHLVWKLVIVAVLIASQIYLHVLLIVFPIAFLVPVVRRLWIQAADLLFGSWYWKTFGRLHRATISALHALPGWHQVFGAMRLWRIRYLCAWRLWKYQPRYRTPEADARMISFAEPLRLWWRGDLDRYIVRPLLAGGTRKRLPAADCASDAGLSASQAAPSTPVRRP